MLEKYILEGKEFMESELGFCPYKTNLSIKSEEKFKKLMVQRNLPVDSKGVIFPRALQAIIRQNSLESMLPIAIHEYLGHGSFYEHNKHGILFLQHELRLEQIENEIIQDSIPKGENFRLRFSKEKSYIKKLDKECVVNVNIAHPLAEEYLTLAQELDERMDSLYHVYEGFAVWLEDFVLSELGMRDIFLNREIAYKNFYQAFKDYESKTGPLTLVTKIGFPKKLDDEKRIKIVKENVKDFENVEYLISFGSEKEYSDINICVIKGYGSAHHIRDENLDFFQIKTSDLEKKLRETSDLSDVSTVKNGRLIYGDKKGFEKLKSIVTKVGPKAVEHHKEEAKNLLQYAKHYYERAVEENNPFLFTISLIDLAYAISYDQCATMYQNGCKTTQTYQGLIELEQGGIIKEIRTIAKNNPGKDKTRELLEKYTKIGSVKCTL